MPSIAAGDWYSSYKRDVMDLEAELSMPRQIIRQTVHDQIGRVAEQKIGKRHSILDEKSYLWGTSDRLLSFIINGEHRRYEYDNRGFLVKTFFEDGSVQLRIPDSVGNLYESPDFKDRTYGNSGRLERFGDWKFTYDELFTLLLVPITIFRPI